MRALAICLSLLAAVALAFGAQLQNDSVSKHDRNADEKQKLGIRQVLSLFAKPKWLSGMSLLFLGGGLQITAISLAPLIVVQPLGGIALVITALLNARVTKTSDPHSPSEFRCNQIAKNFDVFHDTFGTEPGDGMWMEPAQRVSIW